MTKANRPETGHDLGDQSPNDLMLAQLIQYAEDMRSLLSEHGELQFRYRQLETAYASLGGDAEAIERLSARFNGLYLITDAVGQVRYANPRALARFSPEVLFGAALDDLFGTVNVARVEEHGTPICFGDLKLCLTACHAPCHVRDQPIRLPGEASIFAHWFIRADSGDPQSQILASSRNPQSLPEAVLLFDGEGKILAGNETFLHTSGYTAEEIVGQPLSLLDCEFHPCLSEAEIFSQLVRDGQWQGPSYTRIKNGDARRDWTVVTAAADRDGRIGGCLAVFSDLLPLGEMEKRFAYLAHHDILTGLPNRLLLSDRLEQSLEQARRSGASLAVAFIDLDGFKQVNDTLGHAAGDDLLCQVAKRLSASVRKADTVARLGGDEFAVLFQGLKHSMDAELLGRKLMLAFQTPIPCSQVLVPIGASIGIALFPDHGLDAQELLLHADDAMYQAKRGGKSACQIYGQG